MVTHNGKSSAVSGRRLMTPRSLFSLASLILPPEYSNVQGFLLPTTTTSGRPVQVVLSLSKETPPPRSSSFWNIFKNNEPTNNAKLDEEKMLRFFEDAVEDLHKKEQSVKMEKMERELAERKDVEMDLLSQLQRLNQVMSSQRLQHEREMDRLNEKSAKTCQEMEQNIATLEQRLQHYEEHLLERDSKIARLQQDLDGKCARIESEAEQVRLELVRTYEVKLNARDRQIQSLRFNIKQAEKEVLEMLSKDLTRSE